MAMVQKRSQPKQGSTHFALEGVPSSMLQPRRKLPGAQRESGCDRMRGCTDF
jgi:hypothetical protein